ncbi:MAG TPA: methyltransferase domain-containing protein [Gemmataceae bacterium]|nr:methyltransferase domain-containing protein [Gemmataceae bacterium]
MNPALPCSPAQETLPPALNPAGESVIAYYDQNQFLYNLFWSKAALHYGFWEPGTRTLAEAIANTDRFVADCLELGPADRVLDAGCGTGGTSLYLAEHYPVEVVGISLSEVQLRQARRRAAASPAGPRLAFHRRDFTRTGFAEGSFSRVIGIESACHAPVKSQFLRELFRLLRPGGLLVVIDAWLRREPAPGREEELYRDFLRGWALPNIAPREEFAAGLDAAGFTDVRYHDKFEAVVPSSRRIHRYGLAFRPFTWLLRGLRLVPPSVHGHSVGAVNQWRLVKAGLLTYGAFVARR